MFLEALRRRNPGLIEQAIVLHQAGAIPANSFVIDLDAVAGNAKLIRTEADRAGLRVAVGRAIVRNPAALLMDEPLSNLDASLRVKTRTEIKRLQRELKTTVVFVTHDQEEAMVLSDRVAVMDDGVLQQFAEPMEIYRRPANLFVAGFIGSPQMNFLSGHEAPGGHGGERVIGVRPSPKPRFWPGAAFPTSWSATRW